MVKIGITKFPGTNNEWETVRALESFGVETELIEDEEVNKLQSIDGLWIAGGFSYGDVLRAGAIASSTELVKEIKNISLPILGICNGFQILCESDLLQGVLIPNTSTRFICKWINTKVEGAHSYLEDLNGQVLKLPIAHFEGNYRCPEGIEEKYVVTYYCDSDGSITDSANPNGSLHNIAGISSESGQIVGMMPHPERACFKHQGSVDGRKIISAFLKEVRC